MDLSRVILGPIVTEKAERKKSDRTHTIRVAPEATKVDVKNALKKYYDVEVDSVRVSRVGSKVRLIGRATVMQKRHPYKKAMVTLSKDSKSLDIASFK